MRNRFNVLASAFALLFLVASAYAQQGKGNPCTLAGSWYGGSVVAYHMTIIPAGPAGHYTVTFEGMFKNDVLHTAISGTLEKKGKVYEGSGLALSAQDPDFLNPPPIGKLPDMLVGWFSMELVDCNTVKNTIPFFGAYFGAPGPYGMGIWEPGTPTSGVNWIAGGKVPLLDAPDVDMIPILTGGNTPIIETYHRLPSAIKPALLHHN